MKKIFIILAVSMSMGACTSLKQMGGRHKEERQELRVQQKAKKKNLGEKHVSDIEAIDLKYDKTIEDAKFTLKEIRSQKIKEKQETGKVHMDEAKKMKLRLKAERQLLSTKQALEFAVYGTKKHAQLKFIIAELEEFLK